MEGFSINCSLGTEKTILKLSPLFPFYWESTGWGQEKAGIGEIHRLSRHSETLNENLYFQNHLMKS